MWAVACTFASTVEATAFIQVQESADGMAWSSKPGTTNWSVTNAMDNVRVQGFVVTEPFMRLVYLSEGDEDDVRLSGGFVFDPPL